MPTGSANFAISRRDGAGPIASWRCYYQLGIADFGLAEYAKATEEYDKVFSLNPAPPTDYYVKVADVYLAEKAYDKAYAKMQDYLRIDPRGHFAEKIRTIVREMEAAGVLSKSMLSVTQTKKE